MSDYDLNEDERDTIARGVKEIVDNLRGSTPEAIHARLTLMSALSHTFCSGCGDEEAIHGVGVECHCENNT